MAITEYFLRSPINHQFEINFQNIRTDKILACEKDETNPSEKSDINNGGQCVQHLSCKG